MMALIANVNRDPKKGRPAKPDDFHPLRKHAMRTDSTERPNTLRLSSDVWMKSNTHHQSILMTLAIKRVELIDDDFCIIIPLTSIHMNDHIVHIH